ncbi:hypothetical protein AN641_02660 [Candidatus Epulonipiscioides gigas]|nr:hypothetical protein AN641_02660 [Epulopiscium sp. SCG-C07WGA-EpuloA2]
MKTLGKIIVGITICVIFGVPATLIGYYCVKGYSGAYFDMIETAPIRHVSTQNMLVQPKVLEEQVLPIPTTANIADIAEEVEKSVVSITTTIPGNFIIASGEGLGSGVIFSQDEENLYIMTNAHVLTDAVNLVVSSPTLGTYHGELIGMDTHTDIAVVAISLAQIPTENKEHISLAKIDLKKDIEVGDIVLAIGSPLDKSYHSTLTMGVISALDRETDLVAQNRTYIQTDAPINPGNSGGPLVATDGYLIGINTAKLASEDVEGIGFSIPIKEALPIADEIILNGNIERPMLGIIPYDLYESSYFGLQIPVGILVNGVLPQSGADEAGIEVGDIIVKINNQEVLSTDELNSTLAKYQVLESVNVTLIRNSRYKKIKVILHSLE